MIAALFMLSLILGGSIAITVAVASIEFEAVIAVALGIVLFLIVKSKFRQEKQVANVAAGT